MATGTKGGVGIRLFIAGADVVKQGFDQVADSGRKMWAQIALGEKAANPAVVALSRASGEAQGAVRGLANHAGGAANVLGAFGAAGVGVAATMGAVALAFGKAREAMDFADRLQDQADTLGITTDALQEYQYALRITGGDAEKAGGAIAAFREKFGAAQAQLTARALTPFKALGMAPEDLKQFDTVEAALAAVIDKIAALSSESEQAAIAEKLGLSDMLPVIREGEGAFGRLAAEAHSLGVVMDRDLIKRAGETKDQFDTVSQVIDIQLKSAFVDLGPVLVDIMGLVADLAREISRMADLWRDLEHQSTGSIQAQVARLKDERTRIRATYGESQMDSDVISNRFIPGVMGSGLAMLGLTPSSTQTPNEALAKINGELATLEAQLAARDIAPRGATGAGALRPQVKPAGGGRAGRAGRAGADSFTGQLPAETLAAIADGRMTEAEARRLLAAVPDDARVVIVNTVTATTAQAQRKTIADQTSIADLALGAADQNPTLTAGLPDLRSGPFGGLMSPEDKQAWARDIGDATAQGLDAALHDDFWEYLKQQFYRSTLTGVSDAVTEALKGVGFGGSGGGIVSTIAAFFGFGGGRAAGGGMDSGMWYRAGEHGRTELAMVGANGYVADHDAMRRMLGEVMGGAGGGAGRLQVDVSVTADREGLTATVTGIARKEAVPIARAAAMQAYGRSVQDANAAAPLSVSAYQAQQG